VLLGFQNAKGEIFLIWEKNLHLVKKMKKKDLLKIIQKNQDLSFEERENLESQILMESKETKQEMFRDNPILKEEDSEIPMIQEESNPIRSARGEENLNLLRQAFYLAERIAKKY